MITLVEVPGSRFKQSLARPAAADVDLVLYFIDARDGLTACPPAVHRPWYQRWCPCRHEAPGAYINKREVNRVQTRTNQLETVYGCPVWPILTRRDRFDGRYRGGFDQLLESLLARLGGAQHAPLLLGTDCDWTADRCEARKCGHGYDVSVRRAVSAIVSYCEEIRAKKASACENEAE